MPRVPTTDPQVSTGAAPTPFGQSNAGLIRSGGAALSRGLGQAAQFAQKYALQKKEEEESVLLTERTNMLSESLDRLRHDPDTGIDTLKAKDALGSATTYERKAEEAYEHYTKDLSPELKAVFDQRGLRMLQQHSAYIMRHESTQRGVHRKNTYDAMLPRFRRDVMSSGVNFNASNTAEKYREAEVNLNDNWGEHVAKLRSMFGMAKEDAEEIATAFRSTVAKEYLASLIHEKRLSDAEAMLARWEGDGTLESGDAIAVRKLLKPSQDDAIALHQSNVGWDQFIGDVPGEGGLDEQGRITAAGEAALYRWIREGGEGGRYVNDADIQKQMLAWAETRIAQNANFNARQLSEASRTIHQQLEDAEWDYTAVESRLWQVVGADEKEKWQEFARRRLKGEEPLMNWATYAHLMRQEPEKLVQLEDAMVYRQHLDDNHFEKLLNRISRAEEILRLRAQGQVDEAAKRYESIWGAGSYYTQGIKAFESAHRNLTEDEKGELRSLWDSFVGSARADAGTKSLTADQMADLHREFWRAYTFDPDGFIWQEDRKVTLPAALARAHAMQRGIFYSTQEDLKDPELVTLPGGIQPWEAEVARDFLNVTEGALARTDDQGRPIADRESTREIKDWEIQNVVEMRGLGQLPQVTYMDKDSQQQMTGDGNELYDRLKEQWRQRAEESAKQSMTDEMLRKNQTLIDKRVARQMSQGEEQWTRDWLWAHGMSNPSHEQVLTVREHLFRGNKKQLEAITGVTLPEAAVLPVVEMDVYSHSFRAREARLLHLVGWDQNRIRKHFGLAETLPSVRSASLAPSSSSPVVGAGQFGAVVEVKTEEDFLREIGAFPSARSVWPPPRRGVAQEPGTP